MVEATSRSATERVRNIIAQNPGEAITVENLKRFLPDDFKLGNDDLEPFAPVEFEGEPPTPEPDSKALADARDAKPPVPMQPRTPKEAAALAEAIEAATLRRIKADQDLANRRVELLAAHSAERDARSKLAASVTTFQSGFPPLSPSELLRQHAKEQTGIRAAIKDGRLPQRRPTFGKSRVDASAFYQRGGSPAGGGRAYSRGAYPASAYGRVIKPDATP